jgi:hypothetical protein
MRPVVANHCKTHPKLPWLVSVAVTAGTLSLADARASNKFLEIPPEKQAQDSPAYHYANMSDQQVLSELARRGIAFERATPPMPGVRLPIRLTAPLHGVTIHSSLPEDQWRSTPFDILDGRLALALYDFTRILAQHDVVELVHFTIYRPAPVVPIDPNVPQTRHPGGMAIDVGALRKKNGDWLAVGSHWSARIGAKTCGDGGRSLQDRHGRELLSIVCETADQRIFHYMLTPHFDPAHSDHLHLEIKPGVRWFLIN